MLDNLQEREKNLLAIIFAIVVLALFWFVAKPTVDKNKAIKKEIIELQEMLDAPQVSKEDLDKLQSEIKSIEYGINALKVQIPKTEKRGFLIRDLESLTQLNSVEIISFVPKEAISVTLGGKEITDKLKRFLRKKKKAAVKAKVLKTVINIDSNGQFEQYNKLFADIMKYHRAVEIGDISVSKSGAAASLGVDKRFAKSRTESGILEQMKNNDLNVSFSLFAFTSIEDQEDYQATIGRKF